MYETKRRWKITKEDIEAYGTTPGCLGCRTMKAGLPRQNHSENCRKRIEDEIKKTDEGRARVDRSNTRLDEYYASQIERDHREKHNREATLKKSLLHRDRVQQETGREEEPNDSSRTVTEETADQVQSQGVSSEARLRAKMKDVRKTDEVPVHLKDGCTEAKPKEKRRNEDKEEDRQGEKRRRLARLSKGKQWWHWKEEMEEILNEGKKQTHEFTNQIHSGPIMTLYVQDDHEEYFIDDVYGSVLDPEKVKKARLEELRYFQKMGVYERCDMTECWVYTGKNPIKTRWIDTNKTNDPLDESYRSRLVAKEYKTFERPELYSGTPPVELMRMLVSKVADGQVDKRRWCQKYFHRNADQNVVLMYTDISRAYFNAPAPQHKYIEIPDEDIKPGEDKTKLCARLKVAMYGTRDAALAWEKHYSSFLEILGFKRSFACQNAFYHETRAIRLIVHGDDFLTGGPEKEIRKFEQEMSKTYEAKHQPWDQAKII